MQIKLQRRRQNAKNNQAKQAHNRPLTVNGSIDHLLDYVDNLNERLNTNGKSWQGLLLRIGSTVEGQTNERFLDKKAPDGTAWQKLMLNTIKLKGGKDTILVDTEYLQGSFSHYANSRQVVIGSNAEYAKYHQTGTRKMVARPFLGIGKDDEDAIFDVILAYLGE